jgi:hypothetical protein
VYSDWESLDEAWATWVNSCRVVNPTTLDAQRAELATWPEQDAVAAIRQALAAPTRTRLSRPKSAENGEYVYAKPQPTEEERAERERGKIIRAMRKAGKDDAQINAQLARRRLAPLDDPADAKDPARSSRELSVAQAANLDRKDDPKTSDSPGET